jgi:acylphosphatase
MVSVRILIEGEKVQEVGYRIFLLEKALENGIKRIYTRNLDKNKVELLLSDEKDKINSFYEVVKKEKPKGAIVKDVKKEPYDNKIPIPPIDRYFQFLTLEQLSRGREEIIKLPEFVSRTIETVALALKGIDEKFGNVAQKFGIFGQYAKEMDKKLTGMNEKLDKIATLPEKIDTLPERIADALEKSKKKS